MTSILKTAVKFVVSNPEDTNWSMVFSSNGNTVKIGLNWKDKEYSTHEFEVPIKDFKRMADLI